MESLQDHSVGIIPIYVQTNGTRLFCIVHHAAGHWAFPKGHANDGESSEQTARRELREETGVDAIELDTARIFTETYSFEKDGIHYDKHVTYFIGYADSIMHTTLDAFTCEIRELIWLPYEQAREQLTYAEARALLDEVHTYLELKS
jgi:8-oxo-dGTP pyrophosphatase MutT (NUDIX family)